MPPHPIAAGSLADQLEGAERERFERLRRAWHARVGPVDEAERLETDSLAAQAWRCLRLDALEERVMKALLDGEPLEGLPAPQILLRWRWRLERDGTRAVERCNTARRLRPSLEAMREAQIERLARLEAELRACREEPPERPTAADPAPAAAAGPTFSPAAPGPAAPGHPARAAAHASRATAAPPVHAPPAARPAPPAEPRGPAAAPATTAAAAAHAAPTRPAAEAAAAPRTGAGAPAGPAAASPPSPAAPWLSPAAPVATAAASRPGSEAAAAQESRAAPPPRAAGAPADPTTAVPRPPAAAA